MVQRFFPKLTTFMEHSRKSSVWDQLFSLDKDIQRVARAVRGVDEWTNS